MRFPLAALFFIIAAFIFFACWAVGSYLISVTGDAMAPLASDLGNANYNNLLTLLPNIFGFMAALFFIVGILLIFVLESWRDEPEYYYRR